MADIEEVKAKYIEKAKLLVQKNLKEDKPYLDIIYLRVSTKDKQEELDQLPKILERFVLNEKRCLIIKSRESAFQIKKDNSRVFNIVKDIIKLEEFKDIEKRIYVWHLNRLYRNREKLVDFGLEVRKINTKILSVRQKILSDCLKYDPPMNDIMYYMVLQMYGQSAQEESENKSNDIKKSLHKENGRTFSNKGKLYGKKIKTTSGKKITDVELLDKIERSVYLANTKKKMSYREIQKALEEKGYKVSFKWVGSVINRYKEK